MKTPKHMPRQLRRMAKKFDKIVDTAQLDFTVCSTPGSCNTVACHGGWAAYVLDPDGRNFIDGCAALSKYLGFRGGYSDLIDAFDGWAEANPALWGNTNGVYMFGLDGHKAFGDGLPGTTLADIVDHYRAVADRIEAARGAECQQ